MAYAADGEERKRLTALFSRHINAGQLRYLRAGRLDVFEGKREGVGFTDPFSHRRFFDCFTAAGCFNVSRHNPEIMAALEASLETFDMGTYALLSRPKLLLAERLSAVAPGDLNGVLFASGGGEAVDCALKLARGATRRPQIIAAFKAYHGHTGFALSANGKEHYRRFFEPLMPEFSFVPFNDLAAMRAVISRRTAAVIVEPVQGEAGIYPASCEYLQGLRRLCDEHGALLILDEIQTGFGRAGKMFACDHYAIVPDMMTVAKSLGGGLYPLAAVIHRDTPAITSFLRERPDFHVSYSGGTDLGCMVGLAVLNFLERHRLWENAEHRGAQLKDALLALQAEQPTVIQAVRGLGLMVGVEYRYEFLGPMMSEALARHGVFAAYSGNAPQVMRFMAPLTITEAEMEQVIGAIREAVRHMKRILPVALPAARIPGVLRLLNNEKAQIALMNVMRRFEVLGLRRKDSA